MLITRSRMDIFQFSDRQNLGFLVLFFSKMKGTPYFATPIFPGVSNVTKFSEILQKRVFFKNSPKWKYLASGIWKVFCKFNLVKSLQSYSHFKMTIFANIIYIVLKKFYYFIFFSKIYNKIQRLLSPITEIFEILQSNPLLLNRLVFNQIYCM